MIGTYYNNNNTVLACNKSAAGHASHLPFCVCVFEYYISRRYGVQRPFLVTNQQLVDGGEWEPAIMFFAVPIREGFCRLITTLDTLAPHPKTPQWILHWINRK
jgi:hypothetical protein